METDARLTTAEPAFHADDTLEVAEYRTVSALALVSLVLGLASPLCFAWPLLLAIPVIGALVSIAAIRRIDASEGALAGRWMAVAALVLCVASGTGAVARGQVMHWIRTSQAEQFGRDWLELLLAGEAERSFRLTVAGNRPAPPPEPGMPPPKETPYEMFLGSPLVALLKNAGTDSTIEPAQIFAYEPQARGQFIVQQRYLIAPGGAAESHAHPIEAVLTLQRSQLRGEAQPRWLVANFDSAQADHDHDHDHHHGHAH